MADSNKFEIINKSESGIEFLLLKGYLDAHTAPELEGAFEALIKDGKNKIVVGFADLDYISSAGLGVFMAFIEDIRNNGGDIKLACMQPKVFSVFDLLGFPLLFEIFDSEKEAINQFFKEDTNNVG